MHFELQKQFPGLPVFEPVTLVNITFPSNSSTNEACVTRRVLSELNSSYESVFNRSFTESVLSHCAKSEGICRKKSVAVIKQKKRIFQRNICLANENKFSENLAINFLYENDSFQAYQRNLKGFRNLLSNFKPTLKKDAT